MNIFYLKRHMCDELDGSLDYLKKAINMRADFPDWSKSFYDMAAAELEHAKVFYKMINEKFKNIESTDEGKQMKYYKEMIDDSYIEKTGAIKSMQEIYNSK